ncbi:hypothetical protein CHCC14821_2721 [Bacillus paralicheniformis]|nr:hypothetical protein CHCC14821_2721 [Bacillus paralicheniformis]
MDEYNRKRFQTMWRERQKGHSQKRVRRKRILFFTEVSS